MGVVIAYILIGLLVWFGAFYHDYREAAGKWWCSNPSDFANQFTVFHALAGALWPIALFMLAMFGVFIGIGWVLSQTFGRGFTKLAEFLNKHGL